MEVRRASALGVAVAVGLQAALRPAEVEYCRVVEGEVQGLRARSSVAG